MSTVMTRSALVHWGHNPPPEVHSVIVDDSGRHVVTWSDVMKERRERQQRNLLRKLKSFPWRAYKLWVAYFDQTFFGGWHAFLENKDDRTWITPSRCSWPIPQLMDLYPLVLPTGREDDRERWKIEFAARYRRRTHHRKPLGVTYLWWNGQEKPRLTAQG